MAGGGRAVEVEPERLRGWFERFAGRHGDLVEVDGTPDRVRFRTARGTSVEVVVPFGGLRADHAPSTGSRAAAQEAHDPAGSAAGPWAVLDALSAHLAAPRRIGIVLVRLGGYSIGVAVRGVVETSTTGARPVHGRNRKGGSSSGRFARRRDNQVRVALDTAALDDLRADRRLAALLARAEPRVLDVPEPRRAVLDEAARRARAVELVIREPAG